MSNKENGIEREAWDGYEKMMDKPLGKEEMRNTLDAATPGPWAKVQFHGWKRWEIWQSIDNSEIARINHINIETDANAHLIANAPTWLRALLEENERLTEERDAAQQLHNRPDVATQASHDASLRKITREITDLP